MFHECVCVGPPDAIGFFSHAAKSFALNISLIEPMHGVGEPAGSFAAAAAITEPRDWPVPTLQEVGVGFDNVAPFAAPVARLNAKMSSSLLSV
jgi:hypothetical protein